MIIETIVSTQNEAGNFNFAPIGVQMEGNRISFIPFKTSRTYVNLARTGQGVINLTDDVSLFVGTMLENEVPDYFLSENLKGAVIRGVSGYREFRVASVEDLDIKARMVIEVIGQTDFPTPFPGLNRAKPAVIEALIAASRVHILKPEEIRTELARCGTIVSKTGSQKEKEAMERIVRYVDRQLQKTPT